MTVSTIYGSAPILDTPATTFFLASGGATREQLPLAPHEMMLLETFRRIKTGHDRHHVVALVAFVADYQLDAED